VQSLIDEVLGADIPLKACSTCIVHGDLHTDNLFAVLNPQNHRLISVALIDWANVTSGWHPLSDISRLMVDLAYHILPNDEHQKLCCEVVREWGRNLGCKPCDWAVAVTHELAKLMFYRAGSSGEPLLGPEARLAAWETMKRLVHEEIERPADSLGGGV
jgi:aminoglycoside phosphotransferase (APT) family kinase protein